MAVAWADGKMDDNEKTAILQAANESGIDQSHSSYQLISGWLNKKPDASLMASWKDYIGALKQNLDVAG